MFFYTDIVKYGNTLLVRGVENGVPIQKKVKFKPTLYVNDQNGTQVSLYGQKVSPIKFDSMKEAKSFIDMYADVDGFDIYGMQNFISQYINETFSYPVQYDATKIKIAYIDIEVDSPEGFPYPRQAKYPVTAITVKFSDDKHFYTFSLGSGYKERPNQKCFEFDSEEKVLKEFIQFWSNPVRIPHAITGWNITFFDIPYLVNRIARLFVMSMANKLSPWGMLREREVRVNAKRVEQTYDIVGIPNLDYMDLYKKFTFTTPESYKLDVICDLELGEGKLSYDEYSNLNDLYKQNYQKFIEYNIRDVELVEKLEKKLSLMSVVFNLAYKAGVLYGDTLGTVKIWDTFIYRVLSQRGIIIPPEKHHSRLDFEGAYVKPPKPGMYDWVVSFDLNSLYPNTMIQYNMSPETYVGINPDISVESALEKRVNIPNDVCMAPNGTMFTLDKKGFLPEIIEQLYDERKGIKKKKIEYEKLLVDIESEMKKRGLK